MATGDLTDWDTDVTEGFDGWSAPEVGDGGARVEWSYQGDVGLTWTREDGFDRRLGYGGAGEISGRAAARAPCPRR